MVGFATDVEAAVGEAVSQNSINAAKSPEISYAAFELVELL